MKKLAIAATVIIGLIGIGAIAQSKRPPGDREQIQHKIADRNRDGVCDTCGQAVQAGLKNSQGQKARAGYHFGPADGRGNQGSGPGDGSGYGARSGKRSGNQDGAGPGVGRAGKPGAAGAKAKGKNRGRRKP
jgi:hypothetical protein